MTKMALLLVKVKTLSEKAQGNVKHAGLTNVDLFLADGRKLCMRDSSVDIVISGKYPYFGLLSD